MQTAFFPSVRPAEPPSVMLSAMKHQMSTPPNHRPGWGGMKFIPTIISPPTNRFFNCPIRDKYFGGGANFPMFENVGYGLPIFENMGYLHPIAPRWVLGRPVFKFVPDGTGCR